MINKFLFALITIFSLTFGNIHTTVKAESIKNTSPSSTQPNHAPFLPYSPQVKPGLDGQLDRINHELEQTHAQAVIVDSNITSLNSQIEQLNMEMSILEARIDSRENLMKEMLLSYQQNGTYLEILLNNKNINKFIDQTGTEENISEQQESEKNDFKKKQQTLEKKLTELSVLQTNMDRLQNQLMIQQKQYQLFKLKMETKDSKDIKKESIENTYVSTVTNAGKKFIGRSVYVFGGGRNARDIAKGRFDCSGFVHWAFSQAGIEIGASTDSIRKSGKRVSVQDMKPGDLVFFDTYKKDGHVGIYLGDGKFLGSQCSTGVAIVDMTQGYWKNAFKGHVVRV